MKICFPEAGVGFGGSNISTLELISALQKNVDNEVIYAVAQGVPSEQAARSKGIDNIELVGKGGYLGIRHIIWCFSYTLDVTRFLKRHRPDIVHCTNQTVLFWLLPSLFFSSKVVWNVRSLVSPGLTSRIREFAYLCLCDGIIFVSKGCRESVFFKFLLSKKKQAVIKNFVKAEAKFESKHKTFDPLTIGFIGRVGDPIKNYPRALKIVKALSHRNLRFVVLGAEVENQYRIEKLSVEELPFDKKGVDQQYSKIDLLLMTSKAEGSPRVIMEAAIKGIPSLATAVGGVPELIVHGKSGYCFKDDSQAIEYIGCFLDNPTKLIEMGRSGQSNFKEHFSESTVIAQYLGFYQSIAQKNAQKA